MRSSEIVELAGLVATHGRDLIAEGTRLSAAGMREYWVASKCRIDRWCRALRPLEKSVEQRTESGEVASWRDTYPVLHEILTEEILVRVWTAVVTAFERRRASEENGPVVTNILLAHAETRGRVMRLLLCGPTLPGKRPFDGRKRNKGLVRKLFQSRRRSERWTDLLIGYLMTASDVAELAFDPDRARDFAGDIQRQELAGAGRQAWSLTLASLKTAASGLRAPPGPNSDLTQRIAASILACFPSETFDSTGTFHSLWMNRLVGGTEDAAGMIERLLEIEVYRPINGRKRPGSEGKV